MYDVYLAGKMGGRKVKDIITERQEAAELCRVFGLSFYDPAADEELDKLDPESVVDLKADWHNMEGYVHKDDYHVDQCRVLVNLTADMSSVGTGWEVARMFYRNHRPVVYVSPKRASGELMDYASIKVPYIFGNLTDALRAISVLWPRS